MSVTNIPRELHGKKLLGYSLGFGGMLLAEIFLFCNDLI